MTKNQKDTMSRKAETLKSLKWGNNTLPNGDTVAVVNEAITGIKKIFLKTGHTLKCIARFDGSDLLPANGNPYRITKRGVLMFG